MKHSKVINNKWEVVALIMDKTSGKSLIKNEKKKYGKLVYQTR